MAEHVELGRKLRAKYIEAQKLINPYYNSREVG
jgi:hypothetical protein